MITVWWLLPGACTSGVVAGTVHHETFTVDNNLLNAPRLKTTKLTKLKTTSFCSKYTENIKDH